MKLTIGGTLITTLTACVCFGMCLPFWMMGTATTLTYVGLAFNAVIAVVFGWLTWFQIEDRDGLR